MPPIRATRGSFFCRLRRLRPEAQVAQNFGIGLVGGKQVVASGAVLRNILGSIGSRMRPVVAAETAGEFSVPNIVGVGPPGDLHFWKDVMVENVRQRPAGLRDLPTMLGIYFGIILLVIPSQGGGNFCV